MCTTHLCKLSNNVNDDDDDGGGDDDNDDCILQFAKLSKPQRSIGAARL